MAETAPSPNVNPEGDLSAAKRRLASILSCSDDAAFTLMIWGLNALQSGNPEGGGLAFPYGVPPEAITEDMSTRLAIYPWELETLANELLSSPKSIYQTVQCNRWEVVPEIVNLLRRVDDLDFLVRRDSIDIEGELFRLAGRQFSWQQGFLNVPRFYRNNFIYGQGACADYFRDKHGIAIGDLSAIGFAMFASMVQRPNFMSDIDFSLFGLSDAMRDKALAILAAPLADLRQLAARERAQWGIMAYRPSVLRRFPCIRFGARGRRVRSPLPALILDRITSGLFYDVVSGGGPIRDEYGRRFEQYTLRYLQAMAPAVSAVPETKYKVSGNRFDTPDIIVSDRGDSEVRLAIECKASRMSFNARYADEPAADRGYDDIVNAVFQLWRYFSHCRRGKTGRSIAPDGIGLVLTLDSWMVMASSMFYEIFSRAETMARERDPLIEEQDRRPIAFSSIEDFESALTFGTEETFLDALRVSAAPETRGGYVRIHHEDAIGKVGITRAYPFDNLGEMLPWWAIVEEGRAAAAAANS